jgi:hypothetical protein
VDHSAYLNGAALQSLGTSIAAIFCLPGQEVHVAAAELLADVLLRVWDSDLQELAKTPGLEHSMINALDRFCHQDILDPLRYPCPHGWSMDMSCDFTF